MSKGLSRAMGNIELFFIFIGIGAVLYFSLPKIGGFLEVFRLVRVDIPEAWPKLLIDCINFQQLTEQEKKLFWKFAKKSLALVDISSNKGGHIPIKERLEFLLWLYFSTDSDKKFFSKQNEVYIVLNNEEAELYPAYLKKDQGYSLQTASKK